MEHKGLLAPEFRDEDAARKFLEKSRWSNGPVCPHCGVVNDAARIIPGPKSETRKGLWRCNGCKKQFTVTIDSIFEDSHIPIHKWLLAIHLMGSSKKGISAHQLMRNLEIGSYRSAWFMAHRIRWALTREPAKGVFKGIVEADETYVGGKRRNSVPRATKPGERPKDFPGPFDGKAAVVSVLQRGGSVRSHHVERVTARTIRPIIEAMGGRRRAFDDG
jgi:transposase-like protein